MPESIYLPLTGAKSMRVSVVVPCYNKEKFIQGVISSVRRQTHQPDEIIIVDDASTDSSVAIAARYPVRKILHARNRGLAHTRNSGLDATTGDVVIFLDADAFADEYLLEVLLDGYVSDDIAGVGGRGIEQNLQSPYDQWRALHAPQSHGNQPLDTCEYLFGQNCSYRVDVLRQVGGFETFYSGAAGEDMDLGYRLTTRGYKLRYDPAAIVYHQKTDTADSLQRSMHSWYYWAYHAKARNGRHPSSLFVGTLRRLLTDSFADLIFRKNHQLVCIDLDMFLTKMRALIQARRDIHGTRGL